MAKKEYNSFDELPLMFSVQQLADVLSVSKSTAYDLTKEKDFPCIKVKGRVLIYREEFKNWFQKKLKEKK
ncbi:MAG: helix-turn-helix domain-containing protein [Ruminococcaceae bacterium]|jgi:excisionase family DNA binding protein|nr:helix-turn-helix domain-containing protein [Oscillospiraceae bacterium]